MRLLKLKWSLSKTGCCDIVNIQSYILVLQGREGSHSGLVRAPAKRLPWETGVEGSNPSPSARKNDKMKTTYYEVPHFKLYLDNCLDVLTGIPKESIDMIFVEVI